jgi:hypothetical protein
MLDAVTVRPLWATWALQPEVIRWSPVNVQVRVHELTGAPVLVSRTSAVNPVPHWFAVQPTVQAPAAAAGPAWTRAAVPATVTAVARATNGAVRIVPPRYLGALPRIMPCRRPAVDILPP